jgi:hypothetical protein
MDVASSSSSALAFLDALTNPGPQSITFGDEYIHLSLPFDAVA